jgi:dimethylargininase
VLVALTRPVPPSIAECELTHLKREPIYWTRATEQHRQYEAALVSLGCRVEHLPVQPALPDSVFVEDTAVVVGECAVIARPGAKSRRGETATVAKTLGAYRTLSKIVAPGTLDGGDVLQIGRRIYVGLSSRTNTDGARQLAAFLQPFGYTVQTTTVRECLHLKSAVSTLPDGRLLLNPHWIDGAAFGVPYLEVDAMEPHAANVLCVGKTVVCPATAVRTRKLLQSEGYEVVSVDASELAKAEAGLTCCSIVFRIGDRT